MIEIRRAGLKGLGIFASKVIPRGTRLLAERPLFTVDSERQVFAASRHLSKWDRDFLEGLSVNPVKRSAVLGWMQIAWHAIAAAPQHEQRTSPAPFWNSVLQYRPLLEVFRNNNFDIGNGQQAIFRDICRVNHACVPNAQGNFNKTLNQFTIHAIQPIEPGEEVTISYLTEHGALKESRQGRLKQNYGFLCDCPACDTSVKRGREGEAKRITLQERLHAYAEDSEQQDGRSRRLEFEMLKAMLNTYEAEGIAGRELATMHIAAAEMLLKMKKRSEAQVHAERGLQLDKEAVGDDSDLFQDTLSKYNSIMSG